MKLRDFEVIVEKCDDGWFVADVPSLPGCHTQGKSRKEALENIKEAIQLCLEVAAEKKTKAKAPVITVEKVSVYA